MNSRLGRGIASLLESRESFLDDSDNITMVPISQLFPGRFQPRKDFEIQALNELAESIKEHGILQPIVVRKIADKKFEIIAGERRFQAAKIINLEKLPVIIKELNDAQALQLAIIENIQRKELNIIEESESYHRLINEFKYKQEDLAKILSKTRSHIANILRIKKLDSKVKEMLRNNQISFGHAKLLVNIENAGELAEKIVEEKMTVRNAEKLLKAHKKPKKKVKKENNDIDSLSLTQLEEVLQNALNTKVKIENNKIILEFDDMAKLDFIINKFNQ